MFQVHHDDQAVRVSKSICNLISGGCSDSGQYPALGGQFSSNCSPHRHSHAQLTAVLQRLLQWVMLLKLLDSSAKESDSITGHHQDPPQSFYLTHYFVSALSIASPRRALALGVVGLIRLCCCDATLGRLQQDLLQPVGEDDGRKVRQDGICACLRNLQISSLSLLSPRTTNH